MGRRIVHERPQQIPFDDLHYEFRPDLVSRLTWAHGNAGRVAAAGFGFFTGFTILPDWLARETFGTANGVGGQPGVSGAIRRRFSSAGAVR